MKIIKYFKLFCVLVCGFAVVSCSQKTLLPVADLGKVKPLTEEQQLKKQLFFSEAMRSYELYDWEAAKSLFVGTISIDPGCDACFYKLAVIYYRSGYIKEALSLSQSSVRLDTENIWYRVLLAQLYATSGQFSDAINEYQYVLTQRPNMEKLYFDISSLYLRVNQVDSALATLQLAEEKTGYSEPIAGARYEILNALNRHQEALDELEYLVQKFPEAHYFTLLGEQYSAMQQDSLAIQKFEQALLIDADYMPALFGETDSYRRQGDFDVFFQKFNTICEKESVEKKYKIEYIAAMLEIPQFSHTFAAQLDTVFTCLRTPSDSLTEPLYATFLMQNAKPDSAEIVLKNNVFNNYNNEDAWHRFLAIEYFLNHWSALNLYANEAHRVFPENVDFIMLNAIALWQTQKEKEAIEWLEKALPLSKELKQQIQIYAFLGDLYHAQNNSKKAYENYEKVLAADSANVMVLNNYAYYLSEENAQLDKAYSMSKKAIEVEPNNATYLDTFGWILYKMGKPIEAKAIFRQAMIYGGKDSAVILDHYGDVLNALGEKDTAMVYWEMSIQKEPSVEVSAKIKEANTK